MKKLLQRWGLWPNPAASRNGESEQLRLVKHFRNTVGQCAYAKHPMTVSIKCSGYEASVNIGPDDALVSYMFQWAQGVTFQVATQGYALTNEPGKPFPMEEEVKKDVKRYLEWWVRTIIDAGEHPVVMISRREPGIQRFLITPGYSQEVVDHILDLAKSQNKKALTEVEIF